jgi:hypothetical protein
VPAARRDAVASIIDMVLQPLVEFVTRLPSDSEMVSLLCCRCHSTRRGSSSRFSERAAAMIESNNAQNPHRLAAVVIGYATLTVAMTWPVVSTLGSAYAGSGADLYVSLWDMWFVERVVLDWENPLHTQLIFYPDGVSLAYHSVSWRSGLFALPLRALFGPVAGYNLFFLLETFGCAIFMFLLVRRLTRRMDAAFVSGLIFAFYPYRMTQAATHPNLASLMFLPLLLLCMDILMENRRPIWAWATGGCLALVFLTGTHLFIMCSGLLALLWIVYALRGGRLEEGFYRASGWLALACSILCGPLLFRYLGLSSLELSDALEVAGASGQSDLLAFFVPSAHHPWFGGSFQELYASFGQSQKWHAYFGYVPLFLALTGMVARASRWRSAPFAVALVIFWSITLGDVLLVAGTKYDLPLPYDLISGLAPVKALRSPDRFNLVVCLVLPIMAGYGFKSFVQHPSNGILAIVVGLLVIEYLMVPYRTTAADLTLAQSALQREQAAGAVLEIPLTRNTAKQSMYAQTQHGRPLVGGMVARTPKMARQYIQSSPLLFALTASPVSFYDCGDFDLSEQWANLDRDGISHVILNLNRLPPRSRKATLSYFPVPQVAGNDRQRLYRVAEQTRSIHCL